MTFPLTGKYSRLRIQILLIFILGAHFSEKQQEAKRIEMTIVCSETIYQSSVDPPVIKCLFFQCHYYCHNNAIAFFTEGIITRRNIYETLV